MKSKNLLKAVSMAVISCILLGNAIQTKAQGIKSKRLGGADRYETSVNIAKQFNSEFKPNAVVIASGEDYHDAVSSCAFAKQLGAPILLTEGNNLSKPALDFLNSSLAKDKKVYIVGNTTRISSNVESALKNLGFSSIERIAGNDDYDTNAAVASKMNVQAGTPVIIVSGAGYADGISVSSIAAAKGYPILMTDVNSIANSTADQLRKIKPSKVYFVGGTGVISQANRNNIASIAGVSNDNVINLTGADRYETNLNIMSQFKMSGDTVAFAYGGEDNKDGKFADALAGTAYAAAKSVPILLVNNNNNKLQKNFVDSMKYSNSIFYGGTGSISDSLVNILSSSQQTAETSTPNLDDIGKMFNADVKPDPGSSINYVTQAWQTAHVYGKDMVNPNFNQSKANMMTNIPASRLGRTNVVSAQFVYDNSDKKIKVVGSPINGDSFLTELTKGLNYKEDEVKFINAQYYSVLNRFLSQDNSKQKVCIEDIGYIGGTGDMGSSQGISFSTDGKLDFMFGVPYKDAWKDFSSDFKQNFDGCIEFIYIPYYLSSKEKLDSLKSCLYGAFGSNYGTKIYDLIIKCVNDGSLREKYTKYNLDGITVIYDSENGTFGFK